jgi:hypothetical protein
MQRKKIQNVRTEWILRIVNNFRLTNTSHLIYVTLLLNFWQTKWRQFSYVHLQLLHQIFVLFQHWVVADNRCKYSFDVLQQIVLLLSYTERRCGARKYGMVCYWYESVLSDKTVVLWESRGSMFNCRTFCTAKSPQVPKCTILWSKSRTLISKS